MPSHLFTPLLGEVRTLTIECGERLSNRLGDPSARQVALYLPTHTVPKNGRWPLVVWLAGFTSSGLRQPAWQAFGESLPQRLERLIAEQKMGPVAVAMPDAFTSLGGNQYLDSSVFGQWEHVIAHDLVAALEARFPVGGTRQQRAVLGRSSGGYGAMIQAMRHPDRWGAVASHSGDLGFEVLFAGDFPKVATALANHHFDIRTFVGSFWQSDKVDAQALHTLMILAMAASYDPQDDAPFGIHLPFDLETCERDPAAWARWLAHDPVEMVEHAMVRANLRELGHLYFDCGSHDHYFSHFGARRLAKKLKAFEINHVYEEFADGHHHIEYRLDRSLPWIWQALQS